MAQLSVTTMHQTFDAAEAAPGIATVGCAGGQRQGEPPALRRAGADLPQAGDRQVPPHQMGGHGGDARHLLPLALAALGSRAEPAEPGLSPRFRASAALPLRRRDLGPGALFHHRPLDPQCACAVSRHRGGGPRLVRLHLSADRLDRSDDCGGTLLARGPQRADASGQGALDIREDLEDQRHASELDSRRRGDRRRLRLLLPRRADPCPRIHQFRCAGDRLSVSRHLHRHDLCARRSRPRTGLYLYVPLAAHPGRNVRCGQSAHQLSRLPRRATRGA